MQNSPIKIAILDDHAIHLEGLQAIISNEDDIELVAVAQTWENFRVKIRDRRIDIFIIDIHLTRNPKLNREDGIEIAKYLKDHKKGSKTILLTIDTNYAQIKRAKEAEIEGYLLKEETSRELINAIKKLAEENTMYYSPVVTDILFKGEKIKEGLPSFTDRENEILHYFAQGKNIAQTTKEMGVKKSTAITYKKNVMKKLGLSNEVELAVWAVDNGYKHKQF